MIKNITHIEDTISVRGARNTVAARAALDTGASRIFSNLPRGRGWATFPFNTLALTSQYQPILSVIGQRTVGYEAMVIGHNLTGQELRANTIFALSANQDEELFVDWLARALHLRNFANLGDDRGDLFINAYPQTAIEDPHYPDVFARMIDFYSLAPSKLVVEILETGTNDDAQLVDAVGLYRQLDCKIAIDDFGVGFSNFDRLWRLAPDIVKLDGTIIRSAVRESHARLVLANTVKLIKECGATVVIEGIEERNQAKLAVDVGADFLQGFYFARPSRSAMPAALAERTISGLLENERIQLVTGKQTIGSTHI
jgi:EAL domain-containing protein (putative c-di-GMP-specific phosphodiesterase class I)